MKKTLLALFTFISFIGISQNNDQYGTTVFISGTDSLTIDQTTKTDTTVFTSTQKIQIDSLVGVGVSFGSQYQIPYVNASTDDFDYSSDFTFLGDAGSALLYFSKASIAEPE